MALGDIADFVSGGTPSMQNPELWGGDVPWVSAKDMKVLRLRSTEDTLTARGAAKGTRIAPAGSTLLLVRGMTLHNDVPIVQPQVDMAFNQDVKALIASEQVDSTYLLYALLAAKPQLLTSVDSSSHGTGRLNTDLLRALQVPLPPLGEQRRIASILGALDDKIELNRRMSQTLDEMAQAIFKSWFVDHLRDSWPSGGRELPTGWSVAHLGDHIEATRGLSYASANLVGPREGVPLHNLNTVLEGGGYKESGLKWFVGEHKDRNTVVPGDLIVTNVEQGFEFLLIGFGALVPRAAGSVSLFSADLFRVRPKSDSPLTSTYLYMFLRDPRFHRVVAGYSNGTTVNHMPSDALSMPAVVVPPADLIAEYDRVASPMLLRGEGLESQAEALGALRDALLSPLLLGEICVDEIAALGAS
ncbi:MAG: restriction endonuclease subunit S [Coriobacteriia bacterium]